MHTYSRHGTLTDGTGTVSTATNDLGIVKQMGVGESERNVVDAMVRKVGDSGVGCGFLTAVLRSGGEEGTSEFTGQRAIRPVLTSRVQEGLDLGRHHTETSRDT